jgi:hypothetical protein
VCLLQRTQLVGEHAVGRGVLRLVLACRFLACSREELLSYRERMQKDQDQEPRSACGRPPEEEDSSSSSKSSFSASEDWPEREERVRESERLREPSIPCRVKYSYHYD